MSKIFIQPDMTPDQVEKWCKNSFSELDITKLSDSDMTHLLPEKISASLIYEGSGQLILPIHIHTIGDLTAPRASHIDLSFTVQANNLDFRQAHKIRADQLREVKEMHCDVIEDINFPHLSRGYIIVNTGTQERLDWAFQDHDEGLYVVPIGYTAKDWEREVDQRRSAAEQVDEAEAYFEDVEDREVRELESALDDWRLNHKDNEDLARAYHEYVQSGLAPVPRQHKLDR